MSTTKYTPGPWKLGTSGDVYADGKVIASFYKSENDARLGAAAPELLASCKDFVLFWERSGYNEDSAMYQDAKAAIKKATE